MNITKLTATELSAAIREGKATAVEAAEIMLARIEQQN